MERSRRIRRLGAGLAVALAILAVAFAGLDWLDRRFPPPLPGEEPVSQRVVDRDGRLMRAYTVETGRWRLPVAPGAVDERFRAMLVAYEDKRFYEHFGVDPLAILRAAGQFALNGRIVSGGSTLTMQLARLLEPRESRSVTAKLRQMARALQLERRLGKDEILKAYLTLAPYGGNLEGVRAASLAYFGKEPRRLAPAEAALLVALPQLPEARRPDRAPAAARAARNRVLARIAKAGVLTPDEAEVAAMAPLRAARHALPAHAAHLADEAHAADPRRPVIRSTLDLTLQSRLEALAGEAADRLGPRLSVAMVLADHRTGEILARVGSADYFDPARAGQIDMTRAVRSPGSTLKPFIYGLAFEAGLVHPETLIDDRPSSFEAYRPHNFDLTYQGTVTVREALQMSLNVPAVALLAAVGPARLMTRLRRAGVTPRLPGHEPPGLAMGLGGVGLTLKELVTLYASLPRGGAPVALHDRPDAAATGTPASVMSEAASWYVADILAGTPPPDHGRRGIVAYKTGTSYGYRDAWSVGFDGRYVLGVWVGRPDGTAVPDLTGRGAAAPILFDAFSRIAEAPAALPPRPAGAYRADTAALPATLRRFTPPDTLPRAFGTAEGPPAIVYPPAGARVELGAGGGTQGQPLVLKIEEGVPPFRWLANGRPLPGAERRRTGLWRPDGAGFSTLTVIDAEGRSDSVTVFID